MIFRPQHIFILLLAYFAIAVWAGSIFSIGGSTEAREAQVMETIVRTGEWVLPLRNGIVPSKPPLAHWIGAAVGHGIGSVSELVARIPSIFGGGLCLLVTFLIGSSFSRTQGNAIGIIGAAILSLTYGFFSLVIDARVDMVMTAFTTASIGSLLYGISRGAGSAGVPTRYWWFFWLFAACAVLAKGPLGVVLPSIVGLTALSVKYGVLRGCALFFRPRIAWIVAGMIAVSWYLAAAMSGGDDFLGRQIYFENLKRFSGGENVNNKPWWFYGEVFITTALPWSLLVIVAALRWMTTRRKDEVTVEKKMILGWIGIGLLFFSAASGKRDAYLLPLLPAMSLVAAWYLVELFHRMGEVGRSRLLRVPSYVGMCLMVLAAVVMLGVAILVKAPPFEDELAAYIQALLIQVEVWFVAAGALVLLLGLVLSRERRVASLSQWALSWGGVFAVVLFGLAFGLRIKYELKNYRSFAESMSAVVKEAPVTVVKDRFDELFDPVLYYLKREVRVVEAWPSDCEGFLLTRSTSLLKQLEGDGSKSYISKTVFRGSPIPDLIKGKTERELVLVECVPRTIPRASYRLSPAP